jgi:hypothetical protein
MSEATNLKSPTVVLVHGAFADAVLELGAMRRAATT